MAKCSPRKIVLALQHPAESPFPVTVHRGSEWIELDEHAAFCLHKRLTELLSQCRIPSLLLDASSSASAEISNPVS